MTPAFPSYHRCKYEGQYRKGQMHGRGSYLYANGAEYSGYFSQGWEEGPGTYTLHGKREREREREKERERKKERKKEYIYALYPLYRLYHLYTMNCIHLGYMLLFVISNRKLFIPLDSYTSLLHPSLTPHS